jgi:hypothetical protein
MSDSLSGYEILTYVKEFIHNTDEQIFCAIYFLYKTKILRLLN